MISNLQVVRSSDFMNTSTRPWTTPTWWTQSSGPTVGTAPSNSSPRTRRSWPSAGASGRATARPWPIRRWRGLWGTTVAPARSWRSDASWPTSSTPTSFRSWAPRRGGTRGSTPGSSCSCSRITASRATASPHRWTGAVGTDPTRCRKNITWTPASLCTAWLNCETTEKKGHTVTATNANFILFCFFNIFIPRFL